MTYALIAHIFGVILWAGGLCSVALLVRRNQETVVLETSLFVLKRVVVVGMVIAWLAGAHLLASNWAAVYAKAGWMHAKLLLVLGLSAITGIFSAKIKKSLKGQAPLSSNVPMVLGGISALLALCVIVLVELKPF